MSHKGCWEGFFVFNILPPTAALSRTAAAAVEAVELLLPGWVLEGGRWAVGGGIMGEVRGNLDAFQLL